MPEPRTRSAASDEAEMGAYPGPGQWSGTLGREESPVSDALGIVEGLVLEFGLSQLARYHPDAWTRLLDPDRTETAVPLGHGLEICLELVPRLLRPALVGQATFARKMREIAKRALGEDS
jgi:hypothetical protein